MAEEQRLAFIEARDGVAGAIAFARRTMAQYRKAVLMSRKRGYGKLGRPNISHASLPDYRRGFIESYCAFKRYVHQSSVNTE